jgi:hypothetical protein
MGSDLRAILDGLFFSGIRLFTAAMTFKDNDEPTASKFTLHEKNKHFRPTFSKS